MAAPPKVSLLLPTYNYGEFLPEAVESILAQVDVDFELIISDDASQDDSTAIIERYARADGRIRWQRHPANLGMVANWNWCLQQARGDYIKYVFGDDLLVSPRALASLADLLDVHPDAGLAGSARLLLDGETKVTGLWDDLEPGRHDGPGLIARCLRTRRNLVGEPTAVMFRRHLAARGFDPQFRQLVDMEMWFHLLRQGGLVYTKVPLCGFRRHARQQTVINQNTRVSDFETQDVLDRYLACPEVRRFLPPGGPAHRLILFRHRHYITKARAAHPSSRQALTRIEWHLPTRWLVLCWLWHRVTRPGENLWRKITQWLFRLGRSRGPARPDFLVTLPAVTSRLGGKALTPPIRSVT